MGPDPDQAGRGDGPEFFATPEAILSGRSLEVPGERGGWERLALGPSHSPSCHPLLMSTHAWPLIFLAERYDQRAF